MKKLLVFTLVFTTIILLSSQTSMIYATPEDAPGRNQGSKTANGCEKQNKDKVETKNPNCPNDNGGTDPPTDQFTSCDTDGTFGISAQEIQAQAALSGVTFEDPDKLIADISTDGNDVVDNDQELRELNKLLRDLGVDTCA